MDLARSLVLACGAVLLTLGLGVTIAAVGADTVLGADTGGEAVAGPGSSLTQGADESPPEIAPPPTAVTREEYTRSGLDVAAAAATDAQRLRGTHSVRAFEQRFETAPEPEQVALVQTTTTDLGERAAALDDSHAALLAAYAEGDVSTNRLLHRLTRITAAATQHRALAQTVEDAAVGADINISGEIEAQFFALDREIPALESPVTDALVSSPFEPVTVYTQATGDGLVLATSDSTHRRQVTLRNERDRDAPNLFIEEAGPDENPIGLALDRADDLYPEINTFSPPPLDATAVYGIQGPLAAGEVTAYLHGSTKNVFHEVRLLDSRDVPVSGTLTNATDDLMLTVQTTAATGPMRVSVLDGGEPVGGVTIRVDGAPVGTTDPTGGRWVTQPLSGAEVNVSAGGETLSVTVP